MLWKSLSAQHQHWHKLAKISFFSYKIFLEKNRTSISNAPQYSCFYLVIWHQYHFDKITHFSTIFYPSIQTRPLVFKANGCLNFQKHSSISISEKIATWNIFGNFPVKHPYWSPFQVHLGGSQKAVQSSYFIEKEYAPASVKRNSTAHVIAGISQNFKNIQG